LPKDTAALKAISTRYGYLPKILQANLDVNEEIRSHLVNKIISEVDIDQTIGILGLSFKGGSDDVRLSPSYFIIQLLLSKGYQKIAAYDPIANKAFAEAYQLPISYCTTLEELYSTVDVLVLLTNWPVFKENEAKLKQKKIFDYRYALK
jgi:UDPglucose 6-dehydrogenase